MADFIFDDGSFRDPAGKIFFREKKVYRNIINKGIQRYNFLKSSGILESSIQNKYLIDTIEIKKEKFDNPEFNQSIIVEHNKIPYISYPYEWSFTQLKNAAVHHLDFHIYLLNRDITLIDGSAYNIQFIGTKPIFIDLLSIKKYEEGEYWGGHKQFCENFLNPLLLRAKKGIAHNNWFKGNLEGISTNDLNSILSFFDKISWNIFVQVFLLNKLEINSINNQKKSQIKIQKIKKFPKKSYLGLLAQIRKFILGLNPSKKKTVWEKYSEHNTYNEEETKNKEDVVKTFVKKNSFKKVADIGCNNGFYSFVCLNNGCEYVVGFDFDLNAIDDGFKKAKNLNKNYLPLFFDASNPSSNIGWNEKERLSFKKRIDFDGMIALAFEHHLTIAKNIPIKNTIEWLIGIAPKGLIEFVPKNDETIQRMISLKGDIFPDYNENNFKKYILKKAKIISEHKISASGRKIYEYEKN